MTGSAGDLVEQLNAAIAINFESNDVSRLELAMAARRLFYKLETNEEKVLRIINEEPVVFSALQILVEIGLWDAWTADGGGEKDIDELTAIASKDIDPELLRKTDHVVQSCIHFPEFLAKTNYRMPSDNSKSCYIDTYPEKKDYFGRCKENPSYQESFSGFLTLWSNHRRPWTQFYDTHTLLEGSDLSNGSALVVDLGGHQGADLLHVVEKHPNTPIGSLVLEDLPEVITSVNLTTDKIRAVGHDFFEPQPIKGSRAYYFHSVLHDWSDKTVVDILKHVAAVMKPGYSKVLINDIVLPAMGASCYQTALDCFMLQLSGKERTEAVWEKVINEAGMKVVKIWPDGRGYESLIEAELL
ncbi:hypothetical protein ACHAQJ_002228 [Trichoderma viride]